LEGLKCPLTLERRFKDLDGELLSLMERDIENVMPDYRVDISGRGYMIEVAFMNFVERVHWNRVKPALAATISSHTTLCRDSISVICLFLELAFWKEPIHWFTDSLGFPIIVHFGKSPSSGSPTPSDSQ
jgi:hypothetical protein